VEKFAPSRVETSYGSEVRTENPQARIPFKDELAKEIQYRVGCICVKSSRM